MENPSVKRDKGFPRGIARRTLRERMRTTGWAILILGLVLAGSGRGEESQHRIHPGDRMPAFSLSATDGTSFVYAPNQGAVLAVVVLKTGQSHYSRMADELEAIIKELKAGGKQFDCVGVVSGPGAQESARTLDPSGRGPLPLLLDPEFKVWGRLGVIAAPTAIVVGADGVVLWVKAGYGYDFISGLHAQLARALGMTARDSDTSGRVDTLHNASNLARVERHVRMARSLAKRGRLNLAIDEFKKAQTLDPNVIEPVLELGELLCRQGENQAALKVASEVKVKTDRQKARTLLISGWARRQMGELDIAQSLLSQSLELDPRSARSLYELGRVFQSTGEIDRAVVCYREALAQILDGSVGPAGPSP